MCEHLIFYNKLNIKNIFEHFSLIHILAEYYWRYDERWSLLRLSFASHLLSILLYIITYLTVKPMKKAFHR